MRNIFSGIFKSQLKTSFAIFFLIALVVVLTTGFWPFVSGNIFPLTSWGLYNRDFWENVLVEAHGLVFEIFILGLIIVWLDSKRQKNKFVERNIENLWDLNDLNEAEHFKKKIGSIKRLNEAGITKIDVTDLLIKESTIKDVNFKNSRLFGLKIQSCEIFDLTITDSKLNSADFSKSTFRRCKLQNNYFKNSNFEGCKLVGVDFKNSNLYRVKFTNANLESADLRGTDLSRTIFDNANMKNTNIRSCTKLNIEELAKANNLDYLKADDFVIEKLMKLRVDVRQSSKKIHR